MGSPRASFVNRARVSAKSGPYLLLAGIILSALGFWLASFQWVGPVLMGALAILMQPIRQFGWRRTSDPIEMLCLLSMPVAVMAIAYFWLRPAGLLSLGTILQTLSGFFVPLGLFHILTSNHTLRLADEIERG